jgi:hypothetical protein
VADPEASGSYPLTNTSESGTNSERQAKPAQKKMGNLLSVEQQRLDTASKTGVFALQVNGLNHPVFSSAKIEMSPSSHAAVLIHFYYFFVCMISLLFFCIYARRSKPNLLWGIWM